jgi:hypothetical protein
MKQFGRVWSLNVHGRDIKGLDIEFRVERSRKSSQNTAEFTVYNLAADTRKYLSQQKAGLVVEFRAGYADQKPIPGIFLGELRETTSLRDGANWKTIVTSGDGDQAKKRPISFSLGPGTTFENAVKRIIAEMGVQAGNLAGQLLKGKLADSSKQFSQGFTAHGNGDEELRKLLKSGGLEHSYQNGVLQVLPIDGNLGNAAVLLKEGAGLIGSPEVGDKGSIKVRSLLTADIRPGAVFKVEAENVTGFYVAKKCVYVGQSAGADWYTDTEADMRT